MANTKNMNAVERELNCKGEMDYDHINDILLFKVKDREYSRSLEFNNLVIDIDSEDFIVGLQIFDASSFLGVSKLNLKINKWEFKAKISGNSIEVRLLCEINIRNRIRELSPIIVQQNTEGLPNSQMIVCN
ncbi:MAG: DUF2283 domain-containing protein [Nanoarchaeota archaeon]